MHVTTDATDIASKWNGRADDLASEGIAKDHQSAEYASFHERMKSIDWKTEDEEILRSVAQIGDQSRLCGSTASRFYCDEYDPTMIRSYLLDKGTRRRRRLHMGRYSYLLSIEIE